MQHIIRNRCRIAPSGADYSSFINLFTPSLLSADAGLYPSEGLPRTGYFIPVRDGRGVEDD